MAQLNQTQYPALMCGGYEDITREDITRADVSVVRRTKSQLDVMRLNACGPLTLGHLSNCHCPMSSRHWTDIGPPYHDKQALGGLVCQVQWTGAKLIPTPMTTWAGCRLLTFAPSSTHDPVSRTGLLQGIPVLSHHLFHLSSITYLPFPSSYQATCVQRPDGRFVGTCSITAVATSIGLGRGIMRARLLALPCCEMLHHYVLPCPTARS